MKKILSYFALTLAIGAMSFICTQAQTINGPNGGFFGPDLEGAGGDHDLFGFRLKDFGNGTANDIYLGSGDLGIGANREEAPFTWTPATTYSVTWTLDPTIPEMTLDVDGNMLTYGAADINAALADVVRNPNSLTLADLNYMYFGLRNNGGSDVAVNNLTINGSTINNYSGNNVHFLSSDFCQGSPGGVQTISFDLTLPAAPLANNEGSKVEFTFGNDPAAPSCIAAAASVPIPTMGEWALLLFGLSVFTLGLVVVYNLNRQRVAS